MNDIEYTHDLVETAPGRLEKRQANPGRSMAQRFIDPAVDYQQTMLAIGERIDLRTMFDLMIDGGRMRDDMTAIEEGADGFRFTFKDESHAVFAFTKKEVQLFAARPKGALYPQS